MWTVCSGELMRIFKLTGQLLTIVQIAVPIILIIMGSLDFVKAVMAGKDDDIKKAQMSFVKRLIAAIIVFLIPPIVGVILSLLNVPESACVTCVLNPSTCLIVPFLPVLRIK